MTDANPPITASTLRQALAFFLEDDNMIDRLEGETLASLIMRDGLVDAEERQFLQDAIAKSNFDSQALATLQKLLEKGLEDGAVKKA